MPVGCVVFAGAGCELGLPAGCEAGALPGWVASMLVQKAVTLSLPPAAVISAVKAGLSSALPGLLLTCAVYAWQSPRSDGDGLAAGWVVDFPLAAGLAAVASAAAAAAAELAAAGFPVRFAGRCPVAAARATPPPLTHTAAMTALATSSLVALINGLRGRGAGPRWALRKAVTA